MMGALMDTADGENRKGPRSFELVNLAVHGIGSRLSLLPFILPASVRDRAATAALAIGAAIALTATMQLESSPDRWSAIVPVGYETFGPFASPAIIIYALWISAFLAAIGGWTTIGRGVAFVSIPLSVAARGGADAHNMILRPTWTLLGLLVLLAVLVVAGRPAATRASVRSFVVWFLAALALFALPQIIENPSFLAFQEPMWIARPDVISWSPLIALLLAAIFQIAGRTPWVGAVFLVAIPFTAVAVRLKISQDGAVLALVATSVILGAVLLVRVFGFRLQLARVGSRRPPKNRPPSRGLPASDGPPVRLESPMVRPVRRLLLVTAVGTSLVLGAVSAASALEPAQGELPEFLRPQTNRDVLSVPAASSASVDGTSTRFLGTVEGIDIYLGQSATKDNICVIATLAASFAITSAGCASPGGGSSFGLADRLTIGVGNTSGLPTTGRAIQLSQSVVAYVTKS
jgi:hypothetical protein